MDTAQEPPRFIDEHRISIDATRERVWQALLQYCQTSLTGRQNNLLLRLLGTEPPSGFSISQEEPGTRLQLSGRHRFSRYMLVFEVTDLPDGTTGVSARSHGDFPGLSGRAYRLLVIGSRAHVLVVRGMLRTIGQSSR